MPADTTPAAISPSITTDDAIGADSDISLLLAHGAGAGSASPFLQTITQLLTARGIRVHRFDFAYMAARQQGGKRRPPPRADTLVGEYRAAVDTLPPGGRLLIGGKSMGGRVASLLADELYGEGRIAGLVCLGYPFHPPNAPDKLRTSHLKGLACPTLIIQGDRDPFGGRAEVETYDLSPQIAFQWAGDGDHDLGPRGGSGFTRKGNLEVAADAIRAFALTLPPLAAAASSSTAPALQSSRSAGGEAPGKRSRPTSRRGR